MADCASYDCGQDFPQYTQVGCNTKFKGGANVIRLLRCGEDVDPDSPTFAADIQAILDAGNGAKISSVKVNIDAPSSVTGPSLVGCVPDTFISADHTITLVDRNVTPESRDFYNDIFVNFGGEVGGVIISECDAQRTTYYDMAMTLSGGRVFPDQNTDLQRWELTLTGRSTVLPYIIDEFLD